MVRISALNCTNVKGNDTYCEVAEMFGSHDVDVGSYAEEAVWNAEALYPIPEGLQSQDAAPLMCGGATVWTPLTTYGLRAGDRVGVIGIGGLGHLAIQMGAKLGFEVVVFSGTDSKKAEAVKLGASEFHATKGRADFKDVKKLNALLITGSSQPQFDL